MGLTIMRSKQLAHSAPRKLRALHPYGAPDVHPGLLYIEKAPPPVQRTSRSRPLQSKSASSMRSPGCTSGASLYRESAYACVAKTAQSTSAIQESVVHTEPRMYIRGFFPARRRLRLRGEHRPAYLVLQRIALQKPDRLVDRQLAHASASLVHRPGDVRCEHQIGRTAQR